MAYKSKTLQVRVDDDLHSKVEFIKAWQQDFNKKNLGIDIEFTDADILRWAINELHDKIQKLAAE